MLSAQAEAQRNLVFGQQASVNPATDITFPTCPDGLGTCIRVDVYRTAARGNALPMFFGRFVSSSLIAQDVRATATAEVGTADTTSCLRPFGIPDKWSGPGGIFDPAVDTYIPPPHSPAPPGYNLADRPRRRGAVEGRFVTAPAATGVGLVPCLLDVGTGGSRGARAQIATRGGTADWTIGNGTTLIPNEHGDKVGPVNQGVDAILR